MNSSLLDVVLENLGYWRSERVGDVMQFVPQATGLWNNASKICRTTKLGGVLFCAGIEIKGK